jgi:hypothetical protein
MITLGFYFLSLFSCDAQQVAHAKTNKMVQGISKNGEPCLWVFHFFQNAMKVLILCIALSNALEKSKEVLMKNVMFAHVHILFLKCGLPFFFL